jgi:PPM family protein phosphatase
VEIAAAGLTDRGSRRPRNEDALLVRPDVGLFAVADGMGGHAAGEVASRLAVATLEQTLAPRLAAGAPPPDRLRRTLAAAVHSANAAILQRAAANPTEFGMGTTLTALALLRRRGCLIAHAGDSRAYLLRAGTLRQLTEDHTWVREQVRAGLLTPALARRHPHANVITRALGTTPELAVDTCRETLAAGDVLLLCSDGLTLHLDDAELRGLLDRPLPVPRLADELVAAANRAGGLDNITAVVLRVEG